MKKSKLPGKTGAPKGYNFTDLVKKYPDLAAAFTAVLIEKAAKEKPFAILMGRYLGKYIEPVCKGVRAVPLDRILNEVKDFGFNLEIKITYEGKALENAFPVCPWSCQEVAFVLLGGAKNELKRSNVGGRMFDEDVFLIDDTYYTVIKDGDHEPLMIKPELRNMAWKQVDTIFDRFGYRFLKAKAEPEHFFSRVKQKIKRLPTEIDF